MAHNSRQRWIRKPGPGARVNPGHPLGWRMTEACLFHRRGPDGASGRVINHAYDQQSFSRAKAGGPSFGIVGTVCFTAYGANFSAEGALLASSENLLMLDSNTGRNSLSCVAIHRQRGANASVGTVIQGTSSVSEFGVPMYAAQNGIFNSPVFGGWVSWPASLSPTLVSGCICPWVVYGWTMIHPPQAGDQLTGNLYYNGVRVTQASVAHPVDGQSILTGTTYNIGGRNSAGNHACDLMAVYVWRGRGLTEFEMAQIAINPFAMFRDDSASGPAFSVSSSMLGNPQWGNFNIAL